MEARDRMISETAFVAVRECEKMKVQAQVKCEKNQREIVRRLRESDKLDRNTSEKMQNGNMCIIFKLSGGEPKPQ